MVLRHRGLLSGQPAGAAKGAASISAGTRMRCTWLSIRHHAHTSTSAARPMLRQARPAFKEDMCLNSHALVVNNPLLRNNELNLGDHSYELIYPEAVMY